MTAVNRGKIVAKEEKAFGKSMCIEIRECGKNLISNIPAAVISNERKKSQILPSFKSPAENEASPASS